MNIERAFRSAEWRRLSAELRQFFQSQFGGFRKHLDVNFPHLGPGRLPLALPEASGYAAGPPPVLPAGSYTRRRKDPYHTSDFQLVTWREHRWTLTPMQRLVVKRLWEAWESGNPEVSQSTLIQAAGSDASSLRDLFRDSSAWDTLVRRSAAGVYRLAFPTPEEMEGDDGDLEEGEE